MYKIGKLLYLLAMLYWSYQLIFTPEHWIMLDFANIIIHETGHLLFMLFPQFVYILGGSFFQIFVPCFALGYFILTHQKLATIFSLFWIGNNIINVAVYIKDSQAMRLPMFLGMNGIHDWNWLLTQMNLLEYDWLIGNMVFGCGIIFLLISICWLVIASLQGLIKN
jgi:hypothetical protein